MIHIAILRTIADLARGAGGLHPKIMLHAEHQTDIALLATEHDASEVRTNRMGTEEFDAVDIGDVVTVMGPPRPLSEVAP